MDEKKTPPGQDAAVTPPPASPPPAETDLDLTLERIDTEGVLKEGFAGQEM